MNNSIKRILVYRTGSLGDGIMTLPCFHKIRNDFPKAHIVLLTNKPVVTKAAPLEAILGNDHFFDEVINYPVGVRNPKELFALYKQIRSLKIDLMINLTTTRMTRLSALRDYWFFKATGIRKLMGFPSAKDNTEIRIDPETGAQEWEGKRLARRLTYFGEPPLDDEAFWDLRLTKDELQQAALVLHPYTQRDIIAVCAGTKMQSKDWGRENWLRLILTLKQQLPGWVLVMIGAPEEFALSEELLAAWKGDCVNLCGKTSPRVSGAVMKYAALFVGHDSGPMHLAACVGTPCVAIFSSRNLPRQWFPRGNHNRIIYHPVDCAGCWLEVCIEQGKKCILSISVDEVAQAIGEVISERPAERDSFSLSLKN